MIHIRSLVVVTGTQATQVIKPGPGEVTPLMSEDTEGSPKADIVSVRRLSLPMRTITAGHRHIKKAKVYFWREGGFVVFQEIGNQIRSFNLDERNQMVAVPAGTWHAVFARATVNSMIVVASSQDGNDIEWESSVDSVLGPIPPPHHRP
jgi:hypothetical protein